jgi:hypothetical protein
MAGSVNAPVGSILARPSWRPRRKFEFASPFWWESHVSISGLPDDIGLVVV